MNKKEFYVKGMHCPSCEIYIEKELKNIKYICNIKSDHKKQTVTFDTKKDIKNQLLKEDINRIISNNGYHLQDEPVIKENRSSDLLFGFLISFLIFLLFFQIQNLGFLDNISLPETTLATSFFLGIIASFSSCMAVVGALIISLSATYKNKKSLIIFHISRILSFFLLGGFLGLIGSSLTLSQNFYTISGIILFIVMLLLAINLLDVFPFFKNLQPKFPKIFTKKILNKKTSPLLMGFITFFLPCGFTQSMQIVAISSGEILNASLIMLLFALGTFPVLALISFGLSSALKKTNSSLLFKTSGFLVLFFAIYNLLTLLTSLGIIRFSI